jgi:hypothetical protein
VAGVQVPAGGGSWASISDRNVKEHLASVDKLQFLARVLALPITTWNYKTQVASIRHIGPMAQDFFAAFNVGEDDKHITDIDEGGVALAAIQGLNQKLEEEMKNKDAEIASLRAQLAAQLQDKDAQIALDRQQTEVLQQQMRTMISRVEAVEKASAAHAGISLVSSSR